MRKKQGQQRVGQQLSLYPRQVVSLRPREQLASGTNQVQWESDYFFATRKESSLYREITGNSNVAEESK